MASFRGRGTRRTPYRNKQRCLVLATRGINSRYRHLMEDLRAMLPHHKKDSKVSQARRDARFLLRAVKTACHNRLSMICHCLLIAV
jgi:ribosome biogenesis protein BRX1